MLAYIVGLRVSFLRRFSERTLHRFEGILVSSVVLHLISRGFFNESELLRSLFPNENGPTRLHYFHALAGKFEPFEWVPFLAKTCGA